QIKLTTYGATCPPVGTVITATSGPVEWQSLAIGGSGIGTGTTNCANSPGYRCTWTMVNDLLVPGEFTTHYFVFTPPEYVWTQYTQACDYQTTMYRYDNPGGTPYCDYHHQQDLFSAPLYTYMYLPNDGDIIGGTYINFYGNNDATGTPTAVTYTGGKFSNGDC